jgi:hypothetical protein
LLDLLGERHPLPSLPGGVLPLFIGDGVMNLEKLLGQFLAICDNHPVTQDNVVIFFLQTLVGHAYDWYLSFPTSPITCFTDIEDTFLAQYSQPMAYHILITKFT